MAKTSVELLVGGAFVVVLDSSTSLCCCDEEGEVCLCAHSDSGELAGLQMISRDFSISWGTFLEKELLEDC